MKMYTLDWEAAHGIVKAALREDAGLIKKEVARLEGKNSLTGAQIKDLKENREFLVAISTLQRYYGA